MKIKWIICSLAIVLVLFSRSNAVGSTNAIGTALYTDDGKAVAQDRSKETAAVQNGCTPPAETEFRIGLPVWMAGLSGDFGVRGTVADVDIKFSDIFKRIDMIAAGSLYARSHRWEFFADGLYLRLSDT